MQKFNYHTHTRRCGHADNNMSDEDFVKEFIKKGFMKIAFTDHCPEKEEIDHRTNMRMKYNEKNEYLDSIKSLKEKYKNKIEIETGFEIEYLPGQEENLYELKNETDKLILGQHFIYGGKNELKCFRKHDFTNEDILKYAEYIKTAIEKKIPNIIAHPDIYMLNRNNFGEAEEQVARIICSTAEKYGIPVEINLSDPVMYIRKQKEKVKEMYPMGMYQPEIETMDRNELEKLQLERLQKQVKNVYENVPMYRERMDKKGVKLEDIKELKDLAKLPFTTKQDLRDYYPFELFAADKKDIVRIHASSGTTGRQIVAGYTRNDLDMWADCMARQIAAAGGDENSVVQVSYGYGLFTGGLGAHGGSERIGAMTIPTSSGNTERQIRLMIELGATHLCCTPSYAMYLGETINEMGVKDQLSLKAGIFGAEPWTEDMRHQIEQSLGIKAYDVYGLTEITGPGVSYECSAQNGMHVCEDMFIPEIIDPDTEEVLPPGSFGELVFTTITKEGMPMMRYRTRDLCVLDYEKCECGRTLVRMKKPAGRTDDMLIIRGVNVFPSQIEEVLLKIGGDITPNYQIIVGRENNTDTLEVQVEMSEGMLSDDIKSVAAIEKNIVAKLRSTLGLGAKVTLVEPKTITRSEGKAKRVIDNRKLHD